MLEIMAAHYPGWLATWWSATTCFQFLHTDDDDGDEGDDDDNVDEGDVDDDDVDDDDVGDDDMSGQLMVGNQHHLLPISPHSLLTLHLQPCLPCPYYTL